jgi:hypothetical protein
MLRVTLFLEKGGVMEEQHEPKLIRLPMSQRPLAITILGEVGSLTRHQFDCVSDEWCPAREGFPDATNHVRMRIRDAVLDERTQEYQESREQLYSEGHQSFRSTSTFLNGIIVGADCQNKIIYKDMLDECPDAGVVRELLVEPQYRAYSWHTVSYWNLGNFDELLERAMKTKYLLLEEPRVLLFSDELTQLQEGQVVTPYHWGGVFGFLMEDLDTFAVRNQKLFRVKASLSD